MEHCTGFLKSKFGLGTTYEGYNPELLERVLPVVDYIEVTPDAISEWQHGTYVLNQEAVAELKNIDTSVKIVVHGIGLSIGSYDHWNEQYIRLLDALMAVVDVAWHSEHLGYTMVDDQNLGTMLAMPRTEEALDLIVARTEAIQARYNKPFLLENIVHILPDFPSQCTDAAFLNMLSERTGCGLLLDIYNAECDAHNYGFDIVAFLAELNLSRVREIHVACGTELDGLLVDVHSRPTRESTIDLSKQVLAHADSAVCGITYEYLREAVPVLGIEGIVNELRRLRQLLIS